MYNSCQFHPNQLENFSLKTWRDRVDRVKCPHWHKVIYHLELPFLTRNCNIRKVVKGRLQQKYFDLANLPAISNNGFRACIITFKASLYS